MTKASFWNKRPHDVILMPVAPERPARLEDEGKHVFLVDPRASKIETKQAVEVVFDMKAASMNTQNRQGRARRTRSGVGRRKNTKRAITSLCEGSIDIYDGAVG